MLLFLFVFLFLFMPNLYGMNILYVLAFISYIYLFFNIGKITSYISIDWRLVLLFLFAFIYFTVSSILSIGTFNGGYVFLLMAILVFPISISISMYSRCYNSRLLLYKCIFYACVLQFCVFLLSLLIPEVHNAIIASSGSERLIALSSYNGVPLRSFGLARSYTFTMPVFMAFMSGVMVLFYIKYNKLKFLLIAPLFLIVSVFNARIGIVVFLVFVLFSCFRLINNKRVVSLSFISLFIGLISYLFVFNDNVSLELYQLKRLYDGLVEISSLLQGNKVGTFTALFGDMVIFPNEWYEIFFGTGIDIYEREYLNSDVGYILDIYQFGLVGLMIKFFIYSSILYLIISMTNKVDFKECFNGEKFIIQTIAKSLFVILPILHVKGDILSANEVLVLMLLLYSSLILKNKSIKGDNS